MPEVVALVVILLALGLAASFSVANWHFLARSAVTPVCERRVTPPAPERHVTIEPVGYRTTRVVAGPRPKRAAVVFEQARARGPDMRVLPEGTALAVRLNLALSTLVLVRIEAARDGDDVVLHAFALPPRSRHAVADWRERLEAALDPILDALLEELTGVRPANIPRTRVSVMPEAEDERASRRAIDRRGWPRS